MSVSYQTDLQWERKEEAKNNQSEQEKKRILKNEDNISSLWDNFKRSNIHIIGGFQKEKRKSKYLEICLKK